jgi:hypothetical protein
MARSGEPGHVHADLGDQLLGGDHTDPGDLIPPFGVLGTRGDHRLDTDADSLDVSGSPEPRTVAPGRTRSQVRIFRRK